jgi:cysteinyl-tRNA synthetase
VWSGYDVTFVSNITDIEDKIIARAEAEGRDWRDITEKCEAVWYQGIGALGVGRPDHDPHATAYVDQMLDLIGRLVDGGYAYETSDGVYMEVDKVPGYGELAGQPLESLRAGARVEAAEEKRSPIDFVLWKKAKPGEPTWDSPWGPGRPGWHTECVVMSLDLLGEGFDIHCGGLDLRFPHHENERAQAVADGREFARLWFHCGMVEVEGTKMSKSLGNVSNVLDLVENYDPRSYRLLSLQSHYRSPVEVTDETLVQAEGGLDRLDTFARKVAADLPSVAAGEVAPDPAAIERFRSVMDDDLHTQEAMALVFDLVREVNTALAAREAEAAAPKAAAVLEIVGALGLELHGEEAEVPAEVVELAREREDARATRDWPRADAIRDQIKAAGYVVEDTPAGPVVRPA